MAPKPETPFSRSAELDFGFLPGATPVGMRTCYPELQLSTSAANAVAQYLSCKTLPETLQKHHVLTETQLRTLAIRVAPPQPGAARVLSGISPNRLAREVSLVFWTGVFLSPGRRIRVTGKETGPGPGGYG